MGTFITLTVASDYPMLGELVSGRVTVEGKMRIFYWTLAERGSGSAGGKLENFPHLKPSRFNHLSLNLGHLLSQQLSEKH